METNTNSKSEWAEREMGALWKRENSNQKYLTGKIKVDGVEKNVVIFSNKHKQKDSHPDFRVYLSRDRESVAPESVAPEADSSEGDANEELL